MFAALGLLVGSAALLAADRTFPSIKLGNIRREPVAAIWLDDKLAAIACAKSGSLIMWDVERGEIKHEFAVGKQLRGVVRCGDDLLLIDDKSHELIQVRVGDATLRERGRYAVPEFPVSLCAYEVNGKRHVDVASLWSRQITTWQAGSEAFTKIRTRTLPFEPRLLLANTTVSLHDGSKFTTRWVTSAFGGDIAELSIFDGHDRSEQRAIHNIGGLACDAREGFIIGSHQVLNSALGSTREHVGSGSLMKNRLSSFTKSYVLMRSTSKLPRDVPGEALVIDQNADPAGIAFTKRGLLVCLAGVDQVWYREGDWDGDFQRLPVGKRPRTIVARDDVALVLGELDDSVTRIDTKKPAQPVVTKSLLFPESDARLLSPAERGERLFFSARQSLHGLMSCHSCHTDGHTNGLLADTLGDNTYGTPKRVLTLRGTRLTDLWSWNGEMKTLQDNVHKSLRETMHADKIAPADVDDLVAFLHTLPPVPPLKPQPADEADAKQVARGEQIFLREGCNRCHVPPLTFTSHEVYDVGMPDEQGLKKFNPPSLRGVGRLRRLFHDNRATSLTDVFETHGHQLAHPLPAQELRDLIRFLESL
ncbi:cytochrome c peroxidase [Anatilimnocola sp. NA78]|uniref:cytochrome c peroxidase n=1 Tax=Anatilimnocola sp. NA78 TaxID=3415683 RepID=UPI003CE5729A